MIAGLVVATLLGILAGVVTGMVPGLHVNTLAAALLAVGAGLSGFSPLALAAFIVAMAVVHTFVDFIPSLFLGAPDPATALGVLPGHSLLNQGLGYRALKLTVVGGVGTFAVCLLSLPLLFLVLKPVEPFLRSAIPFVLIGISVLFVWRENNMQRRCWAVIIFILSGVLGLLAMENLNIESGIFPMLTGLFGASTLVLSSFRKGGVPPQSLRARVSWKGGRSVLNYLRAAASSLVVSVLPAIGAAQAAGLAKGFRASRDKEDFLMIVGGINTAKAITT